MTDVTSKPSSDVSTNVPSVSDPYQLSADNVKEPPKGLFESLKYIGPGFILSASIVGSGELIATTILGARAGFVLLWFIIFSCIVKVAVQLEFGKHAISTGESTMASLNKLPGPKLGRANWSIWTWLLLMTAKMLQVGGIVGGVVMALEQMMPALEPLRVVMTFVVAASVSLIVYRGFYGVIEKASLVMISLFTVFTIASLVSLQWTDKAITASEITSGMMPNIPQEIRVVAPANESGSSYTVESVAVPEQTDLAEDAALIVLKNEAQETVEVVSPADGTLNSIAVKPGDTIEPGGLLAVLGSTALIFIAIGAFGITGVGGDEIMAYNYWLIEKGYAAYVGPKDESEGWLHRAKGWIKIMYLDALLSMVAYTLMTAMFYVLGAAVLNRMGEVPANEELVSSLSKMYTVTLGSGAKTTFLIGAIVVLYSTLMAALAAWSRLFSDSFGRIGLYSFEDQKARGTAIAIFAWVIPAIWGALFLTFQAPGWMVIIGGVATTVILLIVVFAAMIFRYRRLDPRLKPTMFYDLCLWLSVIAISLVALQLLKKVVDDTRKLISPPAATATIESAEPIRLERQES